MCLEILCFQTLAPLALLFSRDAAVLWGKPTEKKTAAGSQPGLHVAPLSGHGQRNPMQSVSGSSWLVTMCENYQVYPSFMGTHLYCGWICLGPLKAGCVCSWKFPTSSLHQYAKRAADVTGHRGRPFLQANPTTQGKWLVHIMLTLDYNKPEDC